MEQVYWLSSPLEPGTDTRMLLYRYGRFCYAGPVITEPVSAGLEYLPGVLQGVQAVQGQIPYLSEYTDIGSDSPHRKTLSQLERALDVIYAELSAAEPRLATLATQGNAWLDSEETAVYFEFEARPGYALNGSDTCFAKSYRGDVLMTAIWYGPSGCFYVSLTPAAGEEQALVDTLFPSIYGKRRGVSLAVYEPPRGEASAYDEAADDGLLAEAGAIVSGGEGKRGEGDDALLLAVYAPWRIFHKLSVWEASDPVPDPDALRARDDDKEGEELEGEDDGGGEDEDEGEVADGPPQEVLDVSGGNGYTQVYVVMQPPHGVTVQTAKNGLVPRQAVFRFGAWVYSGSVEFPVDNLRLGDVPYLLPALQKQQGRLGYLSEATNYPKAHPLAPVVQSFMAAVGLLQREMEDCQEELGRLAGEAINAWIDADWAASFFELAFAPASIPPALQQVEVIACKLYLFHGTGVILHCVYFQGSIYCVLADSVEDLPLLDVAFPDVTARNRAVQVRTYADAAGRKLADGFPGCPVPRALRVWEGRRKGVPGVGFGAVQALAADGSGVAEQIRAKARARAEADAAQAREAAAKAKVVKAAGPPASKAPVVATNGKTGMKAGTGDSKGKRGMKKRVTEGKLQDIEDEEDDLYDMSHVGGAGGAPAGKDAKGKEGKDAKGKDAKGKDAKGKDKGGAAAAAAGGGDEEKGGKAKPVPAALLNSVARAPHHIAPLSKPAAGGAGASPAGEAAGGIFARNRLALPAGAVEPAAEGKMAEAPWDEAGRPKVAKPAW